MRRKGSFTVLPIALLATTFSTYAQYPDPTNTPLKQLFDQAIREKAFPGGCVQAGTAKTLFVNQCFGYFTYAKKTADQKNSLFDLASLTKTVATTSAIMKLYEQGKIKLSDKVVKYLPEFSGPTPQQATIKSHMTLLQLLTHTSGLPPDNDVFRLKDATVKQRWHIIIQTPVVAFPGTVYRYSDVNFILLGQLVEKVSGMPLNDFVEKYLFKPLNMKHTFFNPAQEYQQNIVPTSYDGPHNALFKGVVDDPTARALGGIAGNAGLFSTLHDLGIFAQMLLNQGEYKGIRIFKASTVALFTHRANLLPMNSRALGWDTVYNPQSILPPEDRALGCFSKHDFYSAPKQFTAGFYIDPNAYGHTGYTGTSLWISKKYGIYLILLTNRVTPYRTSPFPKRDSEKYWRQRINSAVWKNRGFTQKNLTYIEPRPAQKQCGLKGFLIDDTP